MKFSLHSSIMRKAMLLSVCVSLVHSNCSIAQSSRTITGGNPSNGAQCESPQNNAGGGTSQQLDDSYRRYQTAHSNASGAVPTGNRTDVNERVANLESEKQQILRERQEDLDRKIASIQADAQAQMRAIPRRMFVGRRYSMPNPDYNMLTGPIEDTTAAKIANLRLVFEHENRDTIEAYDKRIRGCLDSTRTLAPQPSSSTQTVQLAPQNNTIYVHNYMNFGSSEPVVQQITPLRAVPAKYKAPTKTIPTANLKTDQ